MDKVENENLYSVEIFNLTYAGFDYPGCLCIHMLQPESYDVLVEFILSQANSGWQELCQLPGKYTWLDSLSITEEGNLIVVSNR